jgi:hypothetical protein
MGLVALGLAAGFVYYGYNVAGVAILLIGSAFLFRTLWKIRQVAERVLISDEKIEAWAYGGRRVCLQWDRIGELRQVDLITQTRTIKIVRIISLDRQQQIVITDLLIGFDDLMARIHAQTPHVRTGSEPTLGEKLMRWGF